MKIELVQNEDLTVKTKTGSTVTVPSPAADDTLATMADATLTDLYNYSCDGGTLVYTGNASWSGILFGSSAEFILTRDSASWTLSLESDGCGGFENQDGSLTFVDLPSYMSEVVGGESLKLNRVNAAYRLGSQSDKPLAPAGDYATKGEIPTLPLSIANGGTGATTASAARANLGAVSRTGDEGLTGDYRTTGMIIGSEAVGIDDIAAGDIFEGDNYTVLYSEGILLASNGVNETRTAIPGGKQASDPTNTLPVLATDAQHNLLDYTSGYALAPQMAVYRFSADMSGTSASIPPLTYTGIPTSFSYYCFELEMFVPDTATSLTGPTTSSDPPWIWIPGGELPTYGYAGKTVFIACRMDCASRKVMANCYLVGDSIKVDPVGMETLALAAGVIPTDTMMVSNIQAKLGLSDTATVQDAIDAAS